MKKIISLSFAALLLASAVFAAGDLASLQSEIQAQYDKMSENYQARNVEGYMSAFAPNFVFKMPYNRTTNRDALRTLTTRLMETNAVKSETYVVQSIELDGDNVVATVRRTSVKNTQAPSSANAPAANGPAERSFLYRETWGRTDAGWKIKVRELAENAPTSRKK